MSIQKRALRVDAEDNVAVVAQNVEPGDEILVDGSTVKALGAITIGHKIALRDIPAGTMVIKYGVPIGKASADIPAGSHVHTHNVEDITEQLCREYAEEYRNKVRALL